MPPSSPNIDADKDSSTGLIIRMFGPLFVQVEKNPLPPLRTRKGSWLLALLVLRHSRPVDRVWLAATLWPDSDHTESLKNLRDCLYDLRKALGGQGSRLHSPTPGTLTLDFAGAEVDLLVFEASIARGDADSLERAVGLYSGPLLEGCQEEWVLGERERCQQRCMDALEKLAGSAIEQGAFAQAVQHLRACIRLDLLNESAQRKLMVALENLGDYAGAMQVYREFRLRLHDELQASPAAETTALYEQIRVRARQLAASPPTFSVPPVRIRNERDPEDLPALSPLSHLVTPHNLPPALTSFIGREREIEQIRMLMQTARLLTLVGAGGAGKTRLALQTASEPDPPFPEGVWLVELAPLTAPDLVLQAVAAVLCVREQAETPLLQTLIERLAGRRLLLILDNCEHLLDACAQLAAALLRFCPETRLLATSRERLGIAGEQTYRVPSLALPDPKLPSTLENVESFEAVRLFVERARLIQPGFRLNSQNAAAIATLCHRLDGMPLAIEFAAARLPSLTVEEINDRLDQRFRLLTGGSKTALQRQQTLTAVIDWSYDLLNRAERILLQRLSVFQGGWTLEAAEAVGGGETLPGAGCIDDWEVLDLLSSLVDKSLVVAEASAGRTRYRLLETVRQYAQERLIRMGGSGIVRERHRDYFLMHVEANRSKLAGAEQEYWLNELETEHDNLRLALRFCLEESEDDAQAQLGLRIGAALWWFWGIRGHASEGREQLNALLNHPSGRTATRVRADALNGAGSLAFEMCDYAESRALQEESLAIWRKLGEKLGSANALNNLGNGAFFQGDLPRARSLYEEALTLYRELGDQGSIANTLNNLGAVTSDQGDFAAALAMYEESIAVLRALGNRLSVANTLSNMGRAAHGLGDSLLARSILEEGLKMFRKLEHRSGIANILNSLGDIACDLQDDRSALTLYEECLTIYRDLGDKRAAARVLNSLGTGMCRLGDYASAHARLKEALVLYREVGNPIGTIGSVERFAVLFAREEQPELSVQLWGAGDAARKQIALTSLPADQQFSEREIALLRARLDEPAFARAWAEGCALTLERAAELALWNSTP